jgi:hypothetical protein
MAITFGRLERQIEVPSGNWTCALTDSGGAATVTVAAGEKSFWNQGVTDDTFLEEFEEDLEDAGADNYSVSMAAGEDGTGKITITNDSGNNFQIVWTSTDLRNLLGFSATISGATTQTAPNQAQGIWIPNAPLDTEYGSDDDGWWESDARSSESSSGHIKTLYTAKKQVNSLRWRGITQAKCRTLKEGTTNESFETFWIDGILAEKVWANGAGGPIMLYWNAGDHTINCKYKIVGDSLTTLAPRKMRDGWLGLWEIGLERCVKVP